MTLPDDCDGARDWARSRLRGVANILIASYTSDLRDINEAAIRHDVRLEIEHGFMGFLAAAETALTLDEYVRFVEIAVDELSVGFPMEGALTWKGIPKPRDRRRATSLGHSLVDAHAGERSDGGSRCGDHRSSGGRGGN